MKNPAEPSKKRALATVILLASFGVAGIILFVHDWVASSALIVFYALLVTNTYFSVNYFSRIIPNRLPSQVFIDTTLLILHVALAATLGNPTYFVIVLIALFSVATLKYTMALPKVAAPNLLYRKIKIDALGTIAAVLALCGIIAGYPLGAPVALATIFFFANVHLLGLRPLYGDWDIRAVALSAVNGLGHRHER